MERSCRPQEDHAVANIFKMHLFDHTRTRELICEHEDALKSAETLPEIVEVLRNLSGRRRKEMVRILSSWVRVPKRKGYKSSLVGNKVRMALAASDLLLDKSA